MLRNKALSLKVSIVTGLGTVALMGTTIAQAQTLPPLNVDPGTVLQYNMLTAPVTPAYPYFYSYPWPAYDYPAVWRGPSGEEEPVSEYPSIRIENGVIPKEQPVGLFQTPSGRTYIRSVPQ